MNTLKGEILFNIYISKMDDYSQTLRTAFMELDEDLFPMLEECEKTGKKIVLIDDPEFEGCCDQPFSVQMQ